jgi:hypothetical protein
MGAYPQTEMRRGIRLGLVGGVVMALPPLILPLQFPPSLNMFVLIPPLFLLGFAFSFAYLPTYNEAGPLRRSRREWLCGSAVFLSLLYMTGLVFWMMKTGKWPD